MSQGPEADFPLVWTRVEVATSPRYLLPTNNKGIAQALCPWVCCHLWYESNYIFTIILMPLCFPFVQYASFIYQDSFNQGCVFYYAVLTAQ